MSQVDIENIMTIVSNVSLMVMMAVLAILHTRYRRDVERTYGYRMKRMKAEVDARLEAR